MSLYVSGLKLIPIYKIAKIILPISHCIAQLAKYMTILLLLKHLVLIMTVNSIFFGNRLFSYRADYKACFDAAIFCSFFGNVTDHLSVLLRFFFFCCLLTQLLLDHSH